MLSGHVVLCGLSFSSASSVSQSCFWGRQTLTTRFLTLFLMPWARDWLFWNHFFFFFFGRKSSVIIFWECGMSEMILSQLPSCYLNFTVFICLSVYVQIWGFIYFQTQSLHFVSCSTCWFWVISKKEMEKSKFTETRSLVVNISNCFLFAFRK